MEVIRPGDDVIVKIHQNITLDAAAQQKQYDDQVEFWTQVLRGCNLHMIYTKSDDFGVHAVYRSNTGQGGI